MKKAITVLCETQEERAVRREAEAEALKTKPEWLLAYFAPMAIFGEPYRKELYRRRQEEQA